jgi:sortase A
MRCVRRSRRTKLLRKRPRAPRAAPSYVPDPNAYAEAESERVAEAAEQMMAEVRPGQAIGRIAIPKLGVNAVFVHGTRWGPDLSRGPGHYTETELPGVGRTAGIAAHRTTFGAWFRHIDDLRAGHAITVTLPYATFHYKIFSRNIVDDEDWSIIKDRGFDALVLSACHPLYSAEQRYVVFARLASVKPRGGDAYRLTSKGEPVALERA